MVVGFLVANSVSGSGIPRRLAVRVVCGGVVLLGSQGCALSPVGLAAPQYQASPAEQHWHCGALENAIQVIIAKIQGYNQTARAESETIAPTVSRVWVRMTEGVGIESPSLRDARQERERADAYNALLQAKGCQVVKIDLALKPPS